MEPKDPACLPQGHAWGLGLNQPERLENKPSAGPRWTDNDWGSPGSPEWCTTVRTDDPQLQVNETKTEAGKRQRIRLVTLFRKSSRLDEMKHTVWGCVQSWQDQGEAQGSGVLQSPVGGEFGGAGTPCFFTWGEAATWVFSLE